jgi:hypothetical protein
MKVSTEIDNNFGYEKITQLVDNIPLNNNFFNVHIYMNIIVAIFRLNIPTFWIYLYNQRPLSFKYTLPNFLWYFL